MGRKRKIIITIITIIVIVIAKRIDMFKNGDQIMLILELLNIQVAMKTDNLIG